jgi:hypothetical protein
LLVIGVDRLGPASSRPAARLESLWLVVYFPGQVPITLLPLYPQALGNESPVDPGLPDAFSLTRSGAPSPVFLERLRQEQVWWDGYVLLDETAMVALLDFLGGVSLDGQALDGALALGSIPRSWVDPASALQGQMQVLRAACRQVSAGLSQELDMAGLLSRVDAHMRTDVDLAQAVNDWLALAGSGELAQFARGQGCEFPLANVPYP